MPRTHQTFVPPRTGSFRKERPESPGMVYIFIDNSNLWIQGKKTSAEKMLMCADEDSTWRFDVGKLLGILVGDDSGLSADQANFKRKTRVYASTPPPVDSVWTMMASYGIKVYTYARNRHTNREKEVDNKLSTDVADKASKAFYSGMPAVFIIVSGDRDLRPAVNKVTKKGFHLHLWSWENGLANVFTKPDNPDLFHLHLLDPYLERIGFRQSKFRLEPRFIHGHSIVVLDPLRNASEVDHFLKDLKTPHSWYKFPAQRHGASSEDLAIIPALPPNTGFDDRQRLLMQAKAKLEPMGLVVMAYLEYKQRYSLGKESEQEMAISERFGERNKNYFEALGNRDEDDEEEERGDDAEKGEREGGDGDNGNDKDNTAIERGHKDSSQPSRDNTDHDYTQVDHNWQKQNLQWKKAESFRGRRCDFRRHCSHGSHCKFDHSEEEKHAFRTLGIKRASKYKYCRPRDGQVCDGGKQCHFAHSEDEIFCPTCGATGKHEMKDCPEKWTQQDRKVYHPEHGAGGAWGKQGF
ncbi:hypothetical protein C8A05DRAFT_18753 [Staphylotrichum tortipilum]|uniref:NYN domain-containing protein n=1 Tax=Staphylotrichum tortipilum TaxID=2831512 RepID=A0AAN6MD60_9PEZI|nr:hypothetical protein C8A05DRAFT_18753 [Staphylotrichum longicolle]